MPAEVGSWRAQLRHEREQLGMTQVELGRDVGLSGETIRKYEAGTRTPTRPHLVAVLRVLQVPHARAREILDALDADDAGLVASTADPGYFVTHAEAAELVEQVPWPQFVVNDAQELVAANAAVRHLWRISLPTEPLARDRARLHILAVMAEPLFARHLVNFEECLSVAVGVVKGAPGWDAGHGAGARVEQVLARFATRNPAALATLLHVWETTPPSRPTSRWTYRVLWREPQGDISFRCVASTASQPDGMSFNDWVPEDAASHALFESVIAARGAPGNVGREAAGTRTTRRHGR